MKTPRKDDAFPILLGLLSNVKPYQATRTLLILPCWGGCFGQRLWPYQLRIIIVLTSWQLLNLRSYSTFGEFGTSWGKKERHSSWFPSFIHQSLDSLAERTCSDFGNFFPLRAQESRRLFPWVRLFLRKGESFRGFSRVVARRSGHLCFFSGFDARCNLDGRPIE